MNKWGFPLNEAGGGGGGLYLSGQWLLMDFFKASLTISIRVSGGMNK